MSDIPITTVAAIIIDRSTGGANVLLTRRGGDPFAGQWCLPGGHLEAGESWLSAVRREVKEETGVEFHARFFGSFAEVISEPKCNAVVKVFDGAAVGEAKADGTEVTRLQWFALEEALELPLAFRHNEILQAYADGARSEWREGLLAEYKALRDESIKRIELRQQALTLALTGAGVFVGAVVGKIADPLSVLLFPWLVLAIATVWAHHDVRVGQIGDHVRDRIQPYVPGLSWEGSLREIYGRLPGIYGTFVEYASAGIFVGIDVVCAAVGWSIARAAQSSAGGSLVFVPEVYSVLAALALLLAIPTWRLIRLRRGSYRKKASDQKKPAASKKP